MRIKCVVELDGNNADPSQGPIEGIPAITLEHKLEFEFHGDNLNGPSIGQLEKKFFELSTAIRTILSE